RGGRADVPPKGDRLRDYIWKRQIDSLRGPRKDWAPVIKLSSWLTKSVRKVEQLSMKEFQQKIRPGLNKHWAIPLMVVVSSRLTSNHQVLAIGYEWHQQHNEWDIVVYDPNVPDQESVMHTRIKKLKPRFGGGHQMAFRGFFVNEYRGKKPWWAPGTRRGPWSPGAPTSSPRDPFGTGGKGVSKPIFLPSRP
ncbi:MAG: hypothetical protein V3R49_01820, partial [Gammaproteobacteria bacterium]